MTSVSSPRNDAHTTRHSLSSMRPESSTVTDWYMSEEHTSTAMAATAAMAESAMKKRRASDGLLGAFWRFSCPRVGSWSMPFSAPVCSLMLAPQSVANPSHGLDEARGVPQLLAKRLDMDVDRAAAAVEVPAPHALQQRLSVEHDARAPHEKR